MNNFFYDLNKRLAQLADKQDLHESKVAESEKWIQKAVNPANKGNLHKALHVAQGEKIPKAKIEKATHSKNPKLRHMAQFAKNVANEEMADEGNAFTGKLASTPKGGKFKLGDKEFKDTSSIEESDMEESALQAYLGNKKYGDEGMKALQQAGREHAGKEKMAKIRAKYDKMDEGDMEEGNAFTAALKATPKGSKFKVGGKEFTDTSDLEEGFKEMDAWLASREKEKGTGKFDKKKISTGTVYTRKHEDDEDDDKDDSKSKQADKYASPKKKGRPKSAKPKDQEHVTKGSYKYKMVNGKRVKKEKTKEGLDSDGVMMTRPTNCSMENIEHGEQAEYNDEAGMTKDSLHTIVRHARELESALRSNENMPEWVQEKIGQIKGMMTSVTDYILSTHERDIEQHTGQEGITIEPVAEKAVSQAQQKFMGMAHAMQKGAKIKGASPELKKVAKTMKPSDTHDFAATKHKGLPKHVDEESTDKEDQKAEKAGRRVAKDIEYDEGHKSRDDNRAERAGKKVTKDIEYDDKKDKEKKVDETTVAGSISTASPSGKSKSGGMQFGKGVYEGFDRQVESMITESVDVTETVAEDDGQGKTITVTASGPEADMLMQLLKAAGLSGSSQGCGCGQTPCSCETVDEAYGDTDETLNDPDWPTDKETLAADPELRTYSGGLNGPKSTGQSTTPVLASQLRRQASMEENVELERSLFKTWKNYKG
jgi:hypothetical protein